MHFFKSICIKLSEFLLVLHKNSLKGGTKKDFTNERKAVAALIMNVLTGKLCVREALLKFPKNCEDVCCSVAWHALLHFEADEDISKSDITFRDVQTDFLEGLYNILSEGKELPDNLLQAYQKYHQNVDTCGYTGKEYFWHEMKKNININE